jgi:hypothetical protein
MQHAPTDGNDDGVTITGIINLQGNRGNPNFEFSPTDFYAKILVFTTGCVAR